MVYSECEVFKKRRNVGKRKIACEPLEQRREVEPNESAISMNPQPIPTPQENTTPKDSTSKRKLQENLSNYSLFLPDVEDDDTFDIINFKSFTSLLNDIAVCKSCHSPVSVTSSQN